MSSPKRWITVKALLKGEPIRITVPIVGGDLVGGDAARVDIVDDASGHQIVAGVSIDEAMRHLRAWAADGRLTQGDGTIIDVE